MKTSHREISEHLLQHAESCLEPGERIMARLSTNLDWNLHFHAGLIVLTSQRLLHVEVSRFHEWKLTAVEELILEELGPTTTLHLMQQGNAAWHWRITAGHLREVESFISRFKEQRGLFEEGTESGEDDDEELFIPEIASTKPRFAGKPLLRLLSFSRPWLGLMLVGLGLTVASTGASLLGPWLTMSLVDDVLIPLQSATHEVNVQKVYQFVGGLLGAAVLTWMLQWATTYVVARLAECVTSRMRRTTFEHLQTLSLGYFNKKRTGDLISRIGNDTDDISLFISVNFIDFACDLLTILFTAGVMFTIHPVLALAALGPLPVVAWLVQWVRAHLRGGFA
ncbi:MAG: ABC transporter transmembrane domain-containing protein, partial [Prosthecobacter sp.]